VASVVFSALMVSSALIAAHGALRVPDDLFLDEGEVRSLKDTGATSQFSSGAS